VSDRLFEIDIGARVTCADGPCGAIGAVVIDPVARAVTHLVVVPAGAPGLARLVPIALVSPQTGAIRLSCTRAAWFRLPYVEETELVPAEVFGYEPGDWAWPYVEVEDATVPVEYDALPPREVELRRGARVHAADGALGRVDGFVVHPENGSMTQVLLRVGRLWQRRTVALPVDSLRVDDEGVHVALSRREITSLPPASLRAAPSSDAAHRA
jgi:hypothetical protein